jgi:hypothetical protein
MHPPHVKQQALELIAAGHNDCEVSRRVGIPRGTIRDWRRPTYVSRRDMPLGICPRCWRATKPMCFRPGDYAELLAIYLGDGCISEHARAQRLRVHLDARYPVMNDEIRALLQRCFPENTIGIVAPSTSSWSGRSDTWTILSIYSKHLTCLFPQHGRGKKHQRPILLEPWQRRILHSAPWSFLRGCIRTDGCAFINRTDIHRPKPYEYLSYEFSNMSKDIVDLFVEACDRVGVFTRVTSNSSGRWSVRINRRESVAMMLEHIGMKE